MSTVKQLLENGKEEGELSASDDEGQPIRSDAIPTSRSTPSLHVSVPSANKSIQRSQTGNAGSSNNSANVTPMLMPPASKKIEKKQATLTSVHGKTLPLGANSNLVISFSDDESDSESDIQGQLQTQKIQPKVTSMPRNGKPPISSLAQPKGPRQINRSINKGITKDASSTRTVSHTAYPKVANPSSGNQELQSRNFISAMGRKVSRKEQNSDEIVGLNNDKLQGLRQQIALRENVLRLKAAQPNKDAVGSARKSSVPIDSKQLGTKEPAKKRLKVSGSPSVRPVEDCRMRISTPMALAESYVEKGLPQGENKGKPGAHTNLGCESPGRNGDQIDPLAISQCFVQENTSAGILQKCMREPESNHHGDTSNFPAYKNSSEQNSITSCDLGGAMCSDQLLKTFDVNHQGCLQNSGLWNFLGNTSAPGHSRMDILALTKMEESLEKELEEAQEYRRICEIEERNALKAYRKAQRSLIEANARCSEIYRRREMCSFHFGSLIANDSSLLSPSVCQELIGTGFSIPNKSNDNIDVGPKSNHIGHNPDDFAQQECNRDVGRVNGGTSALPYSHSGQNLGSEPCSDPDASTSDRLPCSYKQAVNRLHSLSSDPNVSPDDDGSFAVDHDSCQHNLERQQEENLEETQGGMYNKSNKNIYVGGNQDSLLLEASLRSKLFARLGMRSESRGVESCYKQDTVIDRAAESDAGSEKTQMSDCSVPLSEKYQQNGCGGASKLEGTVSEAPLQSTEQCPLKEHSPVVQSIRVLEPNGFSPGHDSLPVVHSGPLFQSAFNHFMILRPFVSLEQAHMLQNMSCSLYGDEIQQISLVGTPIYERKIGFYLCDLKVDPFWPFCMYELRGRCNNDECSWQHLKDFPSDSMHQNQHENPGRQHLSTLHQKKQNSATGFQMRDLLLSPTYLVCSDSIKVDSHSYGSFIARRDGQSWWKFFSISLALSSSLRKDMAADGNEGRVEILGNLRKESSYFGSKQSLMNRLKQSPDATPEPLELALLILSGEVDKLEGIIQALSVLSRHLEADPTSETHWIVYLLIYHACERSDGKDDMFSYAVKHNRGSYTLWLMYINSRRQLNDRLVAYGDALSAICHYASASKIERKHASASILDIFLQMIDFLCICGNVTEAIQRICGLVAPAAVSNDPHSLMLSDILTCLTFSDKCVFWVCCVYLVIYRRLPDSIIQGLEMEKELVSIEWPRVDLVGDEKQRALKLLERGVQSVKLCADSGPFERGTQERLAELFALNHALCMMALKEFENCWSLLKTYVIQYPACLELKLLVARMQPNDPQDMDFPGFEELLRNQPKEASGAQCIWNQYVEYAFQGERYEFARGLMARWYESEWNIFSAQNQTARMIDVGEQDLLKSASLRLNVAADQLDVVFGFLNLSLHSWLQKKFTKARVAIVQALKASAPEHFMHCLGEHAMFQLIDEFRQRDEFPISLQLRLLNYYLDLARSFPVKEPLPWKFISNNQNPRVRKLVSNLLTPVSSEFSVVNVALEAWYGPPLLPEKLSKQKDLVDFIEAVLDLVPSNYPLALCVCRRLRKEFTDSDASSASVLFWAGSNLVNTISCAVPVPPEHVWAEAADILGSIAVFKARADRFLKIALSVYPYSVKLWKCYHSLSRSAGNTEAVVEAAREKGIKLD